MDSFYAARLIMRARGGKEPRSRKRRQSGQERAYSRGPFPMGLSSSYLKQGEGWGKKARLDLETGRKTIKWEKRRE